MSKSFSKVTACYKGMLRAVGVEVGPEGHCYVLNTPERPITVNGKAMVVGSDEVFHDQHFDPNEVIIFNPFNQNIMDSETPVMTKFKTRGIIYLNQLTLTILVNMLRLMMSDEESLNMDDGYLDYVANASSLFKSKQDVQKSMDNLKNVLTSSGSGFKKAGYRFVSCLIKRGLQRQGKKVMRTTAVSFPIYNDIVDALEAGAPYKLLDQPVRKMDLMVWKMLIEYIFPDVTTPENYFGDSNSELCPDIQSFMNAYRLLGHEVNRTIKALGASANYENPEEVPGPDHNYKDELIDLKSWADVLDNVEEHRVAISCSPRTEGNKGEAPGVETRKSQVADANSIKVIQQQPQAQPIQQQVQPIQQPVQQEANQNFDYFQALERYEQQSRMQQQQQMFNQQVAQPYGMMPQMSQPSPFATRQEMSYSQQQAQMAASMQANGWGASPGYNAYPNPMYSQGFGNGFYAPNMRPW